MSTIISKAFDKNEIVNLGNIAIPCALVLALGIFPALPFELSQ